MEKQEDTREGMRSIRRHGEHVTMPGNIKRIKGTERMEAEGETKRLDEDRGGKGICFMPDALWSVLNYLCV